MNEAQVPLGENHASPDFLAKIRRVATRVPFSRDILAMYFTMRDPETPSWVKAAVAAAIAYFVLPLDAVPDFIAALGYSDDASVVAATLRSIVRHVQPRHRAAAAQWLQGNSELPR